MGLGEVAGGLCVLFAAPALALAEGRPLPRCWHLASGRGIGSGSSRVLAARLRDAFAEYSPPGTAPPVLTGWSAQQSRHGHPCRGLLRGPWPVVAISRCTAGQWSPAL